MRHVEYGVFSNENFQNPDDRGIFNIILSLFHFRLEWMNQRNDPMEEWSGFGSLTTACPPRDWFLLFISSFLKKASPLRLTSPVWIFTTLVTTFVLSPFVYLIPLRGCISLIMIFREMMNDRISGRTDDRIWVTFQRWALINLFHQRFVITPSDLAIQYHYHCPIMSRFSNSSQN